MIKKLGWVLWWVAIWGLFFLLGTTRLDSDFGWHIQSGKWTWEHKAVPKTDPFSYTMPSYPFVDHEWLSNLGMYLGQQKLGYSFLAGVFATIVTLMVWVVGWGKPRFWSIVPVALGLETLMNRAGVRPQVEDWLMLAILVVWFGNRQVWRKSRWLFPLMMVLWVNLHGGFALGIFFVGLMIMLSWWQEKKIDVWEGVVGLAGIGGTFINPYGWRVWWEVWMQMSDANLRWSIAEWRPFYYSTEFGYWFLAALTIAMAWRYRKRLAWPVIGAVGMAFLAGLSSLRHMALFVVTAIPVATEGLWRFYQEINKDEVMIKRGKVILGIFGGIAAIIVAYSVVSNFGLMNMGSSLAYPSKAVDYLKAHPFEGNLFAPYEWGGYLIAYYPEKKLFIDGRMPSWRRDVEVKGESRWAFKDYMGILQDGNYQELFSKYNVQRVLWSNKEATRDWKWRLKIGPIVWNLGDEDDSLYVKLREKLESDGWKKIYTDESTTIYER